MTSDSPFATTYLLVDGYNIIYAWKELKRLADSSLDVARQKLLDILVNYRGFKNIEIIVVFDAHKVEGGVGSALKYAGVNVIYTREAETADAYIERVSGELVRERIRVMVATSDHLEQMIILGLGAYRLNAGEFYREVTETEKMIRKKIDDPKPVKKNQIYDYIDPETAKILDKMRGQNDGTAKDRLHK